MPDNTKYGLQTDMPYREWFKFKVASIESMGETSWLDATTKAEWSDNHYGQGIVRLIWSSVVADRRAVFPVIYPDANDFKMVSGMDAPVTCGLYFGLAEIERIISANCKSLNTLGKVMHDPHNGILGSKPYWRPNLITGQHYDGISEWPAGYPPRASASAYEIQRVDTKVKRAYWSELPQEYEMWYKDFYTNADALFDNREEFFNHGLCCVYYDEYRNGSIYTTQHGEMYELSFTPKRLKVYFYNPVVNSIEDEAGNPCYHTKDPEGTILIFKGLSFKIPNSSLNVYAWTSQGFEDQVRDIFFKGLQGQGDYLLLEGSEPLIPGTFAPPTNTEIKLCLPDMPVGTYEILLMKEPELGVAEKSQGYAGDWCCETEGITEGQVYEGSRFTFLVGGEYAEVGDKKRGEGTILPLIEMDGKNKLGEVTTKYIAPIDVKSPKRFYEGRLLGMSSMRRALNDKTGLYEVSDMEFEFANHDKYFSKIVALYTLKNQRIQVWRAWMDEPEGWKASLVSLIIDDCILEGPVFRVKAKDITNKYWQQKVPFFRCEESEYPDIDDKAKGKPMREILGDNQLAGDTPGAVEAVYVDTVSYKYLAARRTLYSVGNVYSDGTLVDPGDYSISYGEGGRTYITFDSDQEHNKITFNCKGYSRAGWNSPNGYIQTPPYVIAYLLAYMKHIPKILIDWEVFDDFATYFEEKGEDQCARLVLESEQDVASVLQELLFTFGLKLYVGNDGRIKLGRKDISNFTTDLTIFDQIDLMTPACRLYNINEAINVIKAKFDYYPSASLFTGTYSYTAGKSIEDFEAEIEAKKAWEFPWTTCESQVVDRVTMDLLKLAYGDRKVEFTVPIEWIEELDIFTSFQLQDPFAPSPSGLGEAKHFFYVESLAYDFDGRKITVVGIDIQWLLRKYMIIGRKADLTRDWVTASEWQRTFAYIGRRVTGTFPDGEPNKKIGKRITGGD